MNEFHPTSPYALWGALSIGELLRLLPLTLLVPQPGVGPLVHWSEYGAGEPVRAGPPLQVRRVLSLTHLEGKLRNPHFSEHTTLKRELTPMIAGVLHSQRGHHLRLLSWKPGDRVPWPSLVHSDSGGEGMGQWELSFKHIYKPAHHRE